MTWIVKVCWQRVKLEITGRTCTKCQVWKPFTEFPKHKRGSYGYDNRCKECMKKYSKSLRKAHESAPPKPKECQLCGTSDVKLYLDHCHDTDTTRNLSETEI